MNTNDPACHAEVRVLELKVTKCIRHGFTHEISPLYLWSWSIVQYSHGLCHSLHSCRVGEVGKEALKLWVTNHQFKKTLCV